MKTLLEASVNPPRSFCSHMAIFTDAVWNDTRAVRRAAAVVHGANHFQCYSSNVIFCSGGDEMEMLHHIKRRDTRAVGRSLAPSDVLCSET